MARRFGGRFSPGGREEMTPAEQAVRQDALADAEVDAAGGKAGLMFLPPAILVFTSLGAGPAGLVLGLLGAAALTLGAWLLRDGLRAEAAFATRAVARRPFPRKIAAALLAGTGCALASASGGVTLAGDLLYGAAAAGLHLVAFGLDPMTHKKAAGLDSFQQERVARVVDEAEGYLSEIKRTIAALSDRRLDMQVATFAAQARAMIRGVEEDPRDLTAARKYLGVYLMGARDASARFADLYARRRDEAARAKYEALLTDLTDNFAARTTTMIEGDREAMEIEVKVLRDRLAREGVTVQEREPA
ncbi:5-bromo-4-chloroindolyl phosphate hydrolysis family protein [Wenxinia saemankumensis]|uniref:5-bromo-4-chloroindolyl phosphate hydrolysis protein n=1 Tax=Wenxinia saemankumensis TaxID=1447782 RepID=A0A1M6ENW5_9RHOB|nr:5-bromo-4-chloroindolyl phosphate hydrolysis family protein [Wenxinia saemankumensis]SHI87048.1 5-bromo-4-chloroindolyl phosphate hydrolysis protein [Wenxinia saemankumensis]